MGAKLESQGDVLRLLVPTVPRTFLFGFSCLFLPFFLYVSWRFIPEPSIRWLFLLAGPLCYGTVFGLVFWLQRYHERLGDFLILNRAEQVAYLPRTGQRFPFARVIGLQKIRGRSRHDWEVETDLHLMVAEGGDVVRHYIVSNPDRHLVEQVATFSGFTLEELDLGRHGFRDADNRDIVNE